MENQLDKRKVAIVEDNEFYRETLVDIINVSDSLECVYDTDTAEAMLDWLEKNDCEVLILDIDLPGISGVDAVEIISKAFPNIYCIMLSSLDDDDNIFNSLCFGASGYILKSSQTENIETVIQDILNGGVVISPHIAAKALKLFTKYSEPRKDYGLTLQERKILEQIVNGIPKKQAAEILSISFYTVEKHLQNIYEKLQIHSQIELVSKALKERLV